MLYISKKNIYIMVMSFLLPLLFLGFYKNSKVISTMAFPIKDKVIILDPGHGLPDEGASSNNGVAESVINLSICMKLKKILEQSGITVILTRENENGIYDEESNTIREKKVSDIKNRVKIGNESSADIFVSIHLNKIEQEEYWGWQTFYKKNSKEGKKLADSIQKGLNEIIKKENNRKPLKIENIYIVENVKIPTTIVECGFLSNKEEEKLLQDDDYQEKLAWGIYLGIMNYFYN